MTQAKSKITQARFIRHSVSLCDCLCSTSKKKEEYSHFCAFDSIGKGPGNWGQECRWYPNIGEPGFTTQPPKEDRGICSVGQQGGLAANTVCTSSRPCGCNLVCSKPFSDGNRYCKPAPSYIVKPLPYNVGCKVPAWMGGC